MEEEQYDTSNGFGWPVSLKTYKLGDNILSFVLYLLICFQIFSYNLWHTYTYLFETYEAEIYLAGYFDQ